MSTGALLTVICGLPIAGFKVQAADQGSPRAVDACAFLSDKEIAAALQTKIEPGQRDDSGQIPPGDEVAPGAYSSTCFWRVAAQDVPPTDAERSPASYVILNVMQWPAGSGGGKRFLRSFREAAAAGDIDQAPVPLKIAEEGLWWGDGVAVCKGDRSFGISVHLIGGRNKERTIEENLARMIAQRL